MEGKTLGQITADHAKNAEKGWMAAREVEGRELRVERDTKRKATEGQTG
jgi:hypothetical protein